MRFADVAGKHLLMFPDAGFVLSMGNVENENAEGVKSLGCYCDVARVFQACTRPKEKLWSLFRSSKIQQRFRRWERNCLRAHFLWGLRAPVKPCSLRQAGFLA